MIVPVNGHPQRPDHQWVSPDTDPVSGDVSLPSNDPDFPREPYPDLIVCHGEAARTIQKKQNVVSKSFNSLPTKPFGPGFKLSVEIDLSGSAPPGSSPMKHSVDHEEKLLKHGQGVTALVENMTGDKNVLAQCTAQIMCPDTSQAVYMASGPNPVLYRDGNLSDSTDPLTAVGYPGSVVKHDSGYKQAEHHGKSVCPDRIATVTPDLMSHTETSSDVSSQCLALPFHFSASSHSLYRVWDFLADGASSFTDSPGDSLPMTTSSSQLYAAMATHRDAVISGPEARTAGNKQNFFRQYYQQHNINTGFILGVVLARSHYDRKALRYLRSLPDDVSRQYPWLRKTLRKPLLACLHL